MVHTKSTWPMSICVKLIKNLPQVWCILVLKQKFYDYSVTVYTHRAKRYISMVAFILCVFSMYKKSTWTHALLCKKTWKLQCQSIYQSERFLCKKIILDVIYIKHRFRLTIWLELHWLVLLWLKICYIY